MFPRARAIDRLGLVRVEPPDPLRIEDVRERTRQRLGQLSVAGRASGQALGAHQLGLAAAASVLQREKERLEFLDRLDGG